MSRARVLASSGKSLLLRAAHRGTSESDRLSEAEQPVRLASLESEVPADPIGPLRLEDVIHLALERNPDLVTARAGEPVAHAAFHVAQTYPWNPQVQLQVSPYSRDRDGNDGAVSQQYVVVQTFETGGQRPFREGAAAANWEQVRGTIRQAELMNAAQTTRLFFAALYQRELRDMAEALADLNEQLMGVMQRRKEAGQATRADVELARLQAQSSRRQQRLAELSYQTAIMNLRNQLNLDTNAPLELAGQWVNWRWRPLDDVIRDREKRTPTESSGDAPRWEPGDGAALTPAGDDATLRQLVVARPDVMAARAAAAMAMQNLRLAEAMQRPDLQIGPMWQRDEASTQFWGVQAQMDIPVVNTGAPLVEQRFAELRQQQITAAQLESRAVLEARAASRRYERARRLVEQSRGEFAGASFDALKSFEDQFRAGQTTLLEVFAARAALIQSQRSYLDLLHELALAAADVAQATGLPPQQLLADTPPAGPLEEVPRP